jgi:hypothetical protein
VLDFNGLDGAVADVIEMLDQLNDLGFEREIVDLALWPWAVQTPEFDLADHYRRRIKGWLAMANDQALDATEIDLLHKLDQPPPS